MCWQQQAAPEPSLTSLSFNRLPWQVCSSTTCGLSSKLLFSAHSTGTVTHSSCLHSSSPQPKVSLCNLRKACCHLLSRLRHCWNAPPRPHSIHWLQEKQEGLLISRKKRSAEFDLDPQLSRLRSLAQYERRVREETGSARTDHETPSKHHSIYPHGLPQNPTAKLVLIQSCWYGIKGCFTSPTDFW